MKITTKFQLKLNLATDEYTGTMNLTYPDDQEQQVWWIFTAGYDRSNFQALRPIQVFIGDGQTPYWEFDLEELGKNSNEFIRLQPEQKALVLLITGTERSFQYLKTQGDNAPRLKELGRYSSRDMGAETMMSTHEQSGTINIDSQIGVASFLALKNIN